MTSFYFIIISSLLDVRKPIYMTLIFHNTPDIALCGKNAE